MSDDLPLPKRLVTLQMKQDFRSKFTHAFCLQVSEPANQFQDYFI